MERASLDNNLLHLLVTKLVLLVCWNILVIKLAFDWDFVNGVLVILEELQLTEFLWRQMKLAENVIHVVGTKLITHNHYEIGLSWIIDSENVQGILDQVLEHCVGVFFRLLIDIENEWQICLFRSHLNFFPVADLCELLEAQACSIDLLRIFGAERYTHVSKVVVFVLNEFAIRVNIRHDPGIVGHFLNDGSVQSISFGNNSWFEKAREVCVRHIFAFPGYVFEFALHENFGRVSLKDCFVRVDVIRALIWLSPKIDIISLPIPDGDELVPRVQNSTEGKIGSLNKALLDNGIEGAVTNSHVEEQHSEGALLHD